MKIQWSARNKRNEEVRPYVHDTAYGALLVIGENDFPRVRGLRHLTAGGAFVVVLELFRLVIKDLLWL